VVVTPEGPGDDFSQHAYGLAVDVNLLNPYVRADGGCTTGRASVRRPVARRPG
jgi:hypothetical protein